MLEKTFESPFDCKESKPVNLKGNQPLIFIEGLMLKLKLRYFGHLMLRVNSLDMSLSKTLGDSKEQGSLVCCISWGHKESDKT